MWKVARFIFLLPTPLTSQRSPLSYKPITGFFVLFLVTKPIMAIANPKGHFVILNKLKTREEGSPEDIYLINEAFEKLGFLNLQPPAVNDFDKIHIGPLIKKLLEYPVKTIPRFLFIMTHGQKDCQLEDGNGNFFHINDI